MPHAKCIICNKTAYSLESLKALDMTYHKLCFKCTSQLPISRLVSLVDNTFLVARISGSICGITLNLKNYVTHDGAIYCRAHAYAATQPTPSSLDQ